ncbi:SMP-30/gluconolactonase/LRE family protein [Silicimonas algicola]|uniref:Sugar lactone lactonase YvrE n=1 Tax=Silicimonas algicola TaxID=1826607 RepID=A0A316G4E3_9RHOB|nr:SMP-30/gluconolactonase/LRE family protein [Silicimonas algicola]AZQ68221.1 SMP-30/gluconolactonase/LRE family protein [Silicimonas algicola]PWK54650.1 sugar lactone lactonase YvrE [Silicimonas algicola]
MEIECVVPSRSRIGEGAVWDDRAGVLWWVDIPAGLIHRYDPSSGVNDSFDWGEPVGCLTVREKGGLVLATKSGFHLFDPDTGVREAIQNPEAGMPDNRFNDGATDAQGRFWAGTMKDGGEPEALGRFYRLDPDLSVTPWKGGIYTTNGMAFSPDGRTMYFSDSNKLVRTIWKAAYDTETGTPGEPEVFFDTREVAGRPDGGTVDADGCYWQAGIDGWQLYRITPEGRIDMTIDVPVERPSKPMFGGVGLDVLFFTSLGIGLTGDRPQPEAGSLHAITGLGITGLPQPRFAG